MDQNFSPMSNLLYPSAEQAEEYADKFLETPFGEGGYEYSCLPVDRSWTNNDHDQLEYAATKVAVTNVLQRLPLGVLHALQKDSSTKIQITYNEAQLRRKRGELAESAQAYYSQKINRIVVNKDKFHDHLGRNDAVLPHEIAHWIHDVLYDAKDLGWNQQEPLMGYASTSHGEHFAESVAMSLGFSSRATMHSKITSLPYDGKIHKMFKEIIPGFPDFPQNQNIIISNDNQGGGIYVHEQKKLHGPLHYGSSFDELYNKYPQNTEELNAVWQNFCQLPQAHLFMHDNAPETKKKIDALLYHLDKMYRFEALALSENEQNLLRENRSVYFYHNQGCEAARFGDFPEIEATFKGKTELIETEEMNLLAQYLPENGLALHDINSLIGDKGALLEAVKKEREVQIRRTKDGRFLVPNVDGLYAAPPEKPAQVSINERDFRDVSIDSERTTEPWSFFCIAQRCCPRRTRTLGK